ncbi:hypothetical protein BIW11_12618, partial [Tropilaelaps mercedesae]
PALWAAVFRVLPSSVAGRTRPSQLSLVRLAVTMFASRTPSTHLLSHLQPLATASSTFFLFHTVRLPVILLLLPLLRLSLPLVSLFLLLLLLLPVAARIGCKISLSLCDRSRRAFPVGSYLAGRRRLIIINTAVSLQTARASPNIASRRAFSYQRHKWLCAH